MFITINLNYLHVIEMDRSSFAPFTGVSYELFFKHLNFLDTFLQVSDVTVMNVYSIQYYLGVDRYCDTWQDTTWKNSLPKDINVIRYVLLSKLNEEKLLRSMMAISMIC